MLENSLNSPLLNSLALTLLHFMWQGLLVAVVLKSVLLILNNSKPQVRYALSAFAMMANLLLPIITFFIVYQTDHIPTNDLANSFALNELIQELKQPDAFLSYQELIKTLPLLLPYVSILWLLTVTLLASKLLIEISTVNKLSQKNIRKPSDELQDRFVELAKQINLKLIPRLLISLKIEVPMAIGWLKPVVLLPANMVSGLNNAQLEMLILHELAHIRRHDYLVNFLQTLIDILLFFHPAVSWVSKQMRNEREYCSDDIAVQHCGDAVAYAHTLADTASLCTKIHNHTIPDMAMAASGGDLKQRVVRLVGHHCASNSNISKWLASATIIFSILLLSSKQLLTIPLLDIWHNQNPWKQTSSISHNLKTHNIENKNNELQIENHWPYLSLSNDVVHTPIAQKLAVKGEYQDLLTTTQLSNNKLPVLIKKESITLKNTVTKTRQNDNKTSTLTLQTTEPTSNKIMSVNASSNFLPTKNTLTSDTQNKNNNANKPLIVEAKLKQTDAINLAQPKGDVLSVSLTKHSQSTKNQANRLTDNHLRKNIINEPANKSDTRLAKAKKITEKKITSTTPIWHNAKQLESADPIYPNIAKRRGIELEVKVDFTIDTDGQIKNLQFVHQQKVSYFKNSIRSAIKQWRFLPAMVGDKPVESQMSKVFAFSLQS